MKSIQSALFGILATFALITSSNAASLGGVYFEVGSSAVGVELDGNHNDTNGTVSTGQLGKTAVTGSYGLGYMLGKSNKLGVDLGYMFTPGEAKLTTSSDHSQSAGDVTFEVSDSTEYYIAPMLNITDDASIYIKFGQNSSDLNITGDVTKLSSMDGSTVAAGTVMSWGSNLYIRTEAGMTEYDKLTSQGLGNTIGTDESVTATPEVHYGKIAIGYKF